MLRFDWKDLIYFLPRNFVSSILIYYSAERKERQLNFCISETWEKQKEKKWKHSNLLLLSTCSIVHEKKCLCDFHIEEEKIEIPLLSQMWHSLRVWYFPVQCDPRIAGAFGRKRNVSGQTHTFLFFCFFVFLFLPAVCYILTECHFWFSLCFYLPQGKSRRRRRWMWWCITWNKTTRDFSNCVCILRCKLQWISKKRDRIICGIFIFRNKKEDPQQQPKNCERENGERDCDTIFSTHTHTHIQEEEELW
jgi:hypothetical protein